MKLNDTILKHKEWKPKIADYLANPNKSIRPEECHERCCELTEWLISDEASINLNRNELLELQKAHKAFHHIIAELIINANRGVEISEEVALGIDSPFHRHYESVLKWLIKVKAKQCNEAA